MNAYTEPLGAADLYANTGESPEDRATYLDLLASRVVHSVGSSALTNADTLITSTNSRINDQGYQAVKNRLSTVFRELSADELDVLINFTS